MSDDENEPSSRAKSLLAQVEESVRYFRDISFKDRSKEGLSVVDDGKLWE